MPRSKNADPTPIVLNNDALAYWKRHSKLIEGLSSGDRLVLKYGDMQPPGGLLDWEFFHDLVEGNNVFALGSREHPIDFDRSKGYSREQALTFLDYIGYETPETMLISLFRDFGYEEPVRHAHSKRHSYRKVPLRQNEVTETKRDSNFSRNTSRNSREKEISQYVRDVKQFVKKTRRKIRSKN